MVRSAPGGTETMDACRCVISHSSSSLTYTSVRRPSAAASLRAQGQAAEAQRIEDRLHRSWANADVSPGQARR
ncbi:hypothetical protein BH23GEM8_BH23GEM8_14840 [soil metagenome]